MAKTPETDENLQANTPSCPQPCSWQTQLEDRVRRLEVTLAEYHAPAVREGGDRVITKLSDVATATQPLIATDRVLVLASSQEQPPPPRGAVLHPPETPDMRENRGWFLLQLLGEFRLALRMYFDPRYRISRTAQFAIPGIILLAVINYFLFATMMNIAVVGPILERTIDVVLFIVAYKLLTWEIARYKDVLAYLSRYSSR